MNAGTDWQYALEDVFKAHKITKVLEFGLGEGTAFFLARAKTKSVEFVAKDSHREWLAKCNEMFGNHENWEVESLETEDAFTPKVQAIVKKQFKKKYDLAFVDCGIHCRADIINMLFGHVPIISAHDTSFGHDDYGWGKIEDREDYERTDVKVGQGTSIWVSKKLSV